MLNIDCLIFIVKDEEEVRLEILAGIQKVNRKAVSNAQKVCYTSIIKLLKITKKVEGTIMLI